jgi:flagellin-like protein
MNFQKLLTSDEERAVSPVIGVILMVAITVILAAVIASFVLGLGSGQEVAPTSTFDFDYDSDNDELTITHTGGDNIKHTELYVRGSNLGDSGQWSSSALCSSSNCASASIDGTDAVTSGDSITVPATTTSSYVVRVVWQSTEGDSSSELATEEGPDA